MFVIYRDILVGWHPRTCGRSKDPVIRFMGSSSPPGPLQLMRHSVTTSATICCGNQKLYKLCYVMIEKDVYLASCFVFLRRALTTMNAPREKSVRNVSQLSQQ